MCEVCELQLARLWKNPGDTHLVRKGPGTLTGYDNSSYLYGSVIHEKAQTIEQLTLLKHPQGLIRSGLGRKTLKLQLLGRSWGLRK